MPSWLSRVSTSWAARISLATCRFSSAQRRARNPSQSSALFGKLNARLILATDTFEARSVLDVPSAMAGCSSVVTFWGRAMASLRTADGTLSSGSRRKVNAVKLGLAILPGCAIWFSFCSTDGVAKGDIGWDEFSESLACSACTARRKISMSVLKILIERIVVASINKNAYGQNYGHKCTK